MLLYSKLISYRLSKHPGGLKMENDKIGNKALTAYRIKITSFLTGLDNIDVNAVKDTPVRHAHIKLQLTTLVDLQEMMKALSTQISERDAEGYFPELKTYQRHINYFKDYVNEYPVKDIELEVYQQ